MGTLRNIATFSGAVFSSYTEFKVFIGYMVKQTVQIEYTIGVTPYETSTLYVFLNFAVLFYFKA